MRILTYSLFNNKIKGDDLEHLVIVHIIERKKKKILNAKGTRNVIPVNLFLSVYTLFLLRMLNMTG